MTKAQQREKDKLIKTLSESYDRMILRNNCIKRVRARWLRQFNKANNRKVRYKDAY